MFVLRIFFEYVSDFPWETHAVTIFGDVPVEKLDKVSVREFSSSSKSEKNKNKNNDDEREEKDDEEAEEDPLEDVEGSGRSSIGKGKNTRQRFFRFPY